MTTRLYQNVTTGEIMHFVRAKEWLGNEIRAELPITDDEAERMLLQSPEIATIDNEISKWYSRYAEFMEADRFLSEEEKAISMYNIYMAISECDHDALCFVKKALRESDDAAGIRLLLTLDDLTRREVEVER